MLEIGLGGNTADSLVPGSVERCAVRIYLKHVVQEQSLCLCVLVAFLSSLWAKISQCSCPPRELRAHTWQVNCAGLVPRDHLRALGKGIVLMQLPSHPALP